VREDCVFIIEDLMLDFDVFLAGSAKSQRIAVTKEMVTSNRIDLSLLEKAG